MFTRFCSLYLSFSFVQSTCQQQNTVLTADLRYTMMTHTRHRDENNTVSCIVSKLALLVDASTSTASTERSNLFGHSNVCLQSAGDVTHKADDRGFLVASKQNDLLHNENVTEVKPRSEITKAKCYHIGINICW